MHWVKGKIGSWFETEEASAHTKSMPESAQSEVKKHDPLTPDLSLKLKSQTKKVLDDIGALFKSETIKDEADIKILNDAKSFIESPTENLEEITKHSTNVGHVMDGYEQQGEDVPPAIDEMHRYLMTLLCVNRIKYIEDEIAKGNATSPEVKYAMKMADDRATHLSRGYKDDTLLTATSKLQERLK
jgi:hypothetical protein